MSLKKFLQKTNDDNKISFSETMAIISENYAYQPSQFCNGLNENKLTNDAGSNEGSCKIFAFAQINQLNKQQTLNLFGDYYRKDVLENPEATDHQNIRNFMQYGWDAIHFDQQALTAK